MSNELTGVTFLFFFCSVAFSRADKTLVDQRSDRSMGLFGPQGPHALLFSVISVRYDVFVTECLNITSFIPFAELCQVQLMMILFLLYFICHVHVLVLNLTQGPDPERRIK